MNRIHIRLLKAFVIFLAFYLVSCDFKEFNEGEWLSTTEKQEELYMHVSPNTMDFGPNDGTTKPLSITSNTSWNISVTHDWCHVSVLSATGSLELTVYCDKNSTNNNRYDTIRVISTVETKKIPVFQSSAPYYISIVDNRPIFDSNGESKTIFVQSNVDWRFKRHPENSSGIATIRKDENELSLTVGNNLYAIERTDTIVVVGVEYTTLSDTIFITQKPQAPYLKVDGAETPVSLNFENGESTRTLTIGSNAEWKAEVNGAAWCSIIVPETKIGSKDGNLTLKVSENPILGDARNATVSITTTSGAPSITRTISIHQSKGDDPILRLPNGMSSFDFDANGNTQTFDIESNIAWKISGVPNWCSITPTESSLNQTVTIVAEKNVTTEKRSATITISSNPASSKVNSLTITLNQDPLDIPGGDDNPNPHYSRKR